MGDRGRGRAPARSLRVFMGVVRLRPMRIGMTMDGMAETPQKQADAGQHQHDAHDGALQAEDAFESIPQSDDDRAECDRAEDMPNPRPQRDPGGASRRPALRPGDQRDRHPMIG